MGGGEARWRQPRTPAPASRCLTARPGEWRGDQRWSGLAYAGQGWLGGSFLAASRAAQRSWDWLRENCLSGRAACGGTGNPEPGPRNWGNAELGALRRSLRQPLGQSAGCRGASGPGPRTYPNSCLVLLWSIVSAPLLSVPSAHELASRPRRPAQSPASRGCWCSLGAALACLSQTGSSLRAGSALTYPQARLSDQREAGQQRASLLVRMNPFPPFASSWE